MESHGKKRSQLLILRCCNITSVESIIMASQPHWSSHMVRGDNRIPKVLLLGQKVAVLGWSAQAVGRCPQSNTEGMQHSPSYMEGSEAVNRSSWCKICPHSTAQFESNRTAHLIAQHEARHAAATNPLPTSSSPSQYHVCPNCSKLYASCIRLVSHCKHKHCK